MRHINWKEKLLITAAVAACITAMYLLKIVCPFLWLTGHPCPGCGMTRALLTLLQGDVPGAFRYHWMVWSLPLLYLLFLLDGRIFRRRWMNRLLPGLLGAGFLLHWLWKLFA